MIESRTEKMLYVRVSELQNVLIVIKKILVHVLAAEEPDIAVISNRSLS